MTIVKYFHVIINYETIALSREEDFWFRNQTFNDFLIKIHLNESQIVD